MPHHNFGVNMYEELRRMLDEAANAVVFTGAGISTESGIPDFRSPGGVWSKMQPIYFDDFVNSEEARRESWRRKFGNEDLMSGATPNKGHKAISKLVEQGVVSHVITQNIDNLHQDSGVPASKVIELHGNATYAKCLSCGKPYDFEVLRAPFLDRGEIVSCPACKGLLKTATISFGQAMPETEMALAEEASLSCDLFIAIGSSLVVYPAAGFPTLAKRRGARLVIINREETDQDGFADLVIHDEIGDVLSSVVSLD